MENYWDNIRAENEKKYQDRKNEERLSKIKQLPGWKLIMLEIFLDVITAIERIKQMK